MYVVPTGRHLQGIQTLALLKQLQYQTTKLSPPAKIVTTKTKFDEKETR